MWVKPAVIVLVRGVFVGGGGALIYCNDQTERAILVIGLILLHSLWTKRVISYAADAKFAAVMRMAARRRGL